MKIGDPIIYHENGHKLLWFIEEIRPRTLLITRNQKAGKVKEVVPINKVKRTQILTIS